jgi:hypothetical protein
MVRVGAGSAGAPDTAVGWVLAVSVLERGMVWAVDAPEVNSDKGLDESVWSDRVCYGPFC